MPNIRSMLITGAAVAAAAIGGATIANAASSSTTSSTSSLAPTARHAVAPRNMPAPGSTTHENAEKVTGTAAAKARAAAVKAVGRGTAGAVTTNFTGNGYEVTVTKSNGGTVEVHLDGSFRAMQLPGHPPGPSGSPAYGY
jgi:hypothetical protein